MMARVVMLAMHRDGRIELPPPKWRQNRPAPITFGPETEPPLLPPPTTLDAVRPLEMRTVVRGDRGGKLWNEYVARYHYLGYKTLVGAQMRYAVHASDGTPLAMLGFSTAAWTLAARDRFIGWSRRQREKNLPLVVDNPRFLILPWIRIFNLGSHILALVRRQLPADWTARYKTTPVLIETFVETPRYTGAVYRALRLDPRRYHPGARALRHEQALRQAEEGHLAAAPPQGLEAHPQPVESNAGYRLGRTLTRERKRSVKPVWTWERDNRTVAWSTARPVDAPVQGEHPDRIGSPFDAACPTAAPPDTGRTERLLRGCLRSFNEFPFQLW